MPSPLQWSFGPFRLDSDNACLWREAHAIALSPKVFAVLHFLVTHPDRLVTKETLLEAVWPEVVVTDAVVRVAIGTLRKVLGDPAQTPRYIATVPRRGYRFLAPVTESHSAAPDPAGTALPVVLQAPPAQPPAAPAPFPGAGLAPPSDTVPTLAAERRQLTVLRCALVNAATLGGQLDLEDLHEVVRAYYQACAAVIQRFEGSMAPYHGDDVLAYFGYPVAHEDDARRAVRAGLGMLEALATLTTRLALPPGACLAVRLGVHTGLTIVGVDEAGAPPEPLALGETPHIAAQMQRLAGPNTLVISAATYQLIAGYFTCESLGEHRLSGLAPPVQAYRVLGPSGKQSRLDVAARGLTPLVGRELEAGLLQERWTRVKAGMGQVVVLEGEAGIGKSRLVQVLKDHVTSEAHTWGECRGLPYYQHTALYPVTELVHRWLQWQPGTAPGETLQQLEAFLAQYRLSLDEAVPPLAGLLALPLPAERYPPQSLTPEQQRHNTLHALLALVGEMAERQPVLVIVEDLHWVDPSTLELLELLIDQVPTRRIYTVLTCRPPCQLPWGFRTHLTPLALNRLTPPEAKEMVRQMLEGKRLPLEVLEQIVVKTDGIPLFVEELTKAVLESAVFTASHDQDVLPSSLPAFAIPTTLHEALLARLDRLGTAKGVAQLGATLGRQFSYPLLRAVAPLEEARLQRDLASLVRAELLYQRGQPPRAVYMFKHALIQDAAYELMLKRTRRQTHQRILQVLETQFPETTATAPEQLAHHALQGELWDRALTYCRQAGEQAMARSAHREAVAAFEQALLALQHLPDSRDTRVQAIDLRLALRSALGPFADAAGRTLAYLREAEGLAAALDDARRLGQVLRFLSYAFAVECAYDQAIAAGQRTLALATGGGDGVLQAQAYHRLGQTYLAQTDYRQALECFGQAVAFFDGQRRDERFGDVIPPAITSRARLVVCHAELGTFTEGRPLGDEGLRMAEAVAQPAGLMLASWGSGLLALHQGDLRRALPLLERAVDICQDVGIPVFFPAIAAALGEAYTLGRRADTAVPLLTQGLAQTTAIGAGWFQALSRLPLGEAQMQTGHLEAAHVLAAEALAHACQYQERGHQAYALRLLGDLAARREPPERALAESYYQQALTLADELGMRPLQAHCHRGLGTLYATTGQREQARATLSTAIELYRAMDMTFWLPQAEAVLAQVEKQ